MPYESLNRKFRNAQKNIDREISHVNVAASAIETSLEEDSSADAVSDLLSSMVAKLKVLKRKVCLHYLPTLLLVLWSCISQYVDQWEFIALLECDCCCSYR